MPHSASSWEDIKIKRLIPALKSKKIFIQDLINLLRTIEEYGHQHIFLYSCSKEKAGNIMDQNRILTIMDTNGLTGLTQNPRVLDQPTNPEIVDIRWETLASEIPNQLLIKIIETRETSELIGEKMKGDILTKQWRIKKERAVNLFKLHDDGILELRITSQRNSSKYNSEVEKMWKIVSDFIPKDSFIEISLSKTKEEVWNKRELYRDKIRFSDSTLKNDIGNTIKATTGMQSTNLYEDEGVKDSMKAFYEHEGYCDSHNIWFKMPNESEQNKPREIHVLLSGELNEFAIPAQCTSQEYEYVLNQLRSFNK